MPEHVGPTPRAAPAAPTRKIARVLNSSASESDGGTPGGGGDSFSGANMDTDPFAYSVTPSAASLAALMTDIMLLRNNNAPLSRPTACNEASGVGGTRGMAA